MSNTSLKVTREQLYDLVWSKPTIHLAKEFGISDVAIAKICKKLNVPKPAPGYWARLEAGKPCERPALPKVDGSVPEFVVIREYAMPCPPEITRKEVLDRVREVTDPANAISVAPPRSRLHVLVRATRDALVHGRKDEYGRLWPTTGGGLDVRVSKASLGRALRIMDAVLKAVESMGYAVKAAAGDSRSPEVVIDGEPLDISLWERVLRSDNPRHDADIGSRWSERKRTYSPAGLLTFVIDEFVGDGVRRKWQDLKLKSLEQQLNEILAGLLIVAETKRLKRLEREESERRCLEEARIRKERERQWIEEQARRGALEEAAESWVRSRNLRAFLEACGCAIEPDSGSMDERVDVRWLDWARRHADRIDPLTNGSVDALISKFPA